MTARARPPRRWARAGSASSATSRGPTTSSAHSTRASSASGASTSSSTTRRSSAPAVKHFLELDEPTWDLVLDANLKGHFLCTARAARHMVEQGAGVIINTSSGGASRAHRGMVAYDAAKGGVEAFTRAVALDLAPYGVRCMCIVPGPDGDLRAGARGRGARARDGRDGATRPSGHRRRHRRRSGLPGRRGRRLPHRIVHLRRRRRAAASSARRRSRRSRSIAFPASAAWPEIPYDTTPAGFSPSPDRGIRESWVFAVSRCMRDDPRRPETTTTTNGGGPSCSMTCRPSCI